MATVRHLEFRNIALTSKPVYRSSSNFERRLILWAATFSWDQKWCDNKIQAGDCLPSWISKNCSNFQTVSAIFTKFGGKIDCVSSNFYMGAQMIQRQIQDGYRTPSWISKTALTSKPFHRSSPNFGQRLTLGAATFRKDRKWCEGKIQDGDRLRVSSEPFVTLGLNKIAVCLSIEKQQTLM